MEKCLIRGCAQILVAARPFFTEPWAWSLKHFIDSVVWNRVLSLPRQAHALRIPPDHLQWRMQEIAARIWTLILAARAPDMKDAWTQGLIQVIETAEFGLETGCECPYRFPGSPKVPWSVSLKPWVRRA